VSNISKGNYILSVSFKGKTWSRYVLLQWPLPVIMTPFYLFAHFRL
jgi:hypothetical protein